MKIHSTELQLNGKVASVSGQTSRLELINLFGEPDDIGGFSRKSKRGRIIKYGDSEFHFEGDQDDDSLFLIYREQLVAGEYVPEMCIKFNAL